jgi:hypothetical protein
VTGVTPAELRELVAKARAENRRARVVVLEDRARRFECDRLKTEAITARLRAGGPSASERAICAEFHVSPKRVVRLRAVVAAERREAVTAASAPGPASSPRAQRA